MHETITEGDMDWFFVEGIEHERPESKENIEMSKPIKKLGSYLTKAHRLFYSGVSCEIKEAGKSIHSHSQLYQLELSMRG